jgi:hypothetical protein
MIPIEKNIAVYDPSGALLEATYPRRAAGLVKKGRARFTAPDSITLNARPPGTEDFMIDNINETAETAADVTTPTETAAEAAAIKTPSIESPVIEIAAEATPPDKTALNLVNRYRGFVIEMKPREWRKNPAAPKDGVCNRMFYTEDNGEFREYWELGNWQWGWSEIITGELHLEPYTEYRMLFWLSGGDHHERQNICRFEVTFDDDYENRSIYGLIKNCVKPLLTKGEWKLFCIPFMTGGNERTTFRFVAQNAPVKVKPAFYDELGEIITDRQSEKLPFAETDFGNFNSFDGFAAHVRKLQEHFSELEDMIDDDMDTDEITDQINILSDIIGRLASGMALRQMRHH